MLNQKSITARPLTTKHPLDNANGMRISADVLESVCRKMIKIILYCLPHATRGTIYSVGPIPDLRVLRIASGHRKGQADEIIWDKTSRSDYDFPGKIWENYRDRPGGILEAMAWCVETQTSWTADEPENNCRSVRKQLEGKAGEDYHHMEPVLVTKTDLWEHMPSANALPFDGQGQPMWQASQYATVAVVKIHFQPDTLRRGDRSTRIVKELSRSLGTEMLSLHAKEMTLEKEKRFVSERQDTCDTIAHEFRNLVTRMGLAYRAVNNEIAYLRESWENLIQQYLPEQSSKHDILKQLNHILQDIKADSHFGYQLNKINRLILYQQQMMECCFLPQQNAMWLRNKIKPLWLYILSSNNMSAIKKKQIEDLLERLNRSFYFGQDKDIKAKIKFVAEDIKTKWIELAYREINRNRNGMLKDYIELLDNPSIPIPRKSYSLKNFIYFKRLIETIPDVEEILNHRLDLLKKT